MTVLAASLNQQTGFRGQGLPKSRHVSHANGSTALDAADKAPELHKGASEASRTRLHRLEDCFFLASTSRR